MRLIWNTARFFSATLLLATLTGPVAAEPKDTPFGITFTTASVENGVTAQDIFDTFDNAALVGSTVMIVYLWLDGDEAELQDIIFKVSLARQYGLKVIIQFAATGVGLPTPPDGLPKTWASAETRNRYFADLTQLARMQPDYLILLPEVNIMWHYEPAEYDIYKNLYPEIYGLAKTLAPNSKIGVSYLDSIWGRRNMAGLENETLSPRDFIGFTTYPDGINDSVAEIPMHWYSQIRVAYPNEPIIFSEVGWGSSTPSSEAEQAEFVAALPGLMEFTNPELVIWALTHEADFFTVGMDRFDEDSLAFLESLGIDPQDLFDQFNSLGLLRSDGSPKPAWGEALLLDFGSTESASTIAE